MSFRRELISNSLDASVSGGIVLGTARWQRRMSQKSIISPCMKFGLSVGTEKVYGQSAAVLSSCIPSTVTVSISLRNPIHAAGRREPLYSSTRTILCDRGCQNTESVQSFPYNIPQIAEPHSESGVNQLRNLAHIGYLKEGDHGTLSFLPLSPAFRACMIELSFDMERHTVEPVLNTFPLQSCQNCNLNLIWQGE